MLHRNILQTELSVAQRHSYFYRVSDALHKARCVNTTTRDVEEKKILEENS